MLDKIIKEFKNMFKEKNVVVIEREFNRNIEEMERIQKYMLKDFERIIDLRLK